MIAEVSVLVFLTAAGWGTLAPLSQHIEGQTRMWLSAPTGLAVYLLVATASIAATGSLDPLTVVLVSGALGAVGALSAAMRGAIDSKTTSWLAAAVAVTIATVVLGRLLHLTRLTPDSLRYLILSVELAEPNALEQGVSLSLLARPTGLPSLQALHGLVDRRYMASIGPLYGVFGLGYFARLIWSRTKNLDRRQRVMLLFGAGALLISSNRLLYDVFYVNGHIEVAVYLLIAISGAWIAVTDSRRAWAVPASLALSSTLVFRPEMALVVAIVLVALAASSADWVTRVLMVAPSVVMGALWYGLILWRSEPGGDEIGFAAPVFASLVILTAAVSSVLLGGITSLRSVMRHADHVLLIAMVTGLVILAFSQPQILIDSATATVRNVVYDGLWLFTWVVVVILLALALMANDIPNRRLWTVPILGFACSYWLLPFIREGAWRIGEGDSGNRILAHVLSVVVAFIVLAAVDWRDGRGRAPAP